MKGNFMRRIILVIAAMLILVSLTGCDTIKKISNMIEVGEKVEHPYASMNGAEVDVISADNKSLTIKIVNKTDSTWQSGNMKDYRLEKEKDCEWYEVNQIGEYANTMELMIFAPGEELTHTFNFADRYGTLTSGKYRVVKAFWANRTDTMEAHEFYLVCEFDVK